MSSPEFTIPITLSRCGILFSASSIRAQESDKFSKFESVPGSYDPRCTHVNTTNRRVCGAERRTSQLVSSKVLCRLCQDSDGIAGISATLGATVIKDRVRVSSDEHSRNFGIRQFSGTIRVQSVSLRGEGELCSTYQRRCSPGQGTRLRKR